jgi:hypothetical protein
MSFGSGILVSLNFFLTGFAKGSDQMLVEMIEFFQQIRFYRFYEDLDYKFLESSYSNSRNGTGEKEDGIHHQMRNN